MDANNRDETFLARWLNNELSEKELKEFQLSEDYLLYKEIAEKSKMFCIPDFKKELTYQQIETEIGAKKKPKVLKLVPNWAFVAAASIALLLGILQFIHPDTTIATGIGEQLAVDLPDGSLVKLKGQSTLSYNENEWAKGKRSLDISGAGYFKVKKGATFSVKTKEGTVTVLGTQFNVQVAPNYLEVACYEGKVRVREANLQAVLTQGKGIKFANHVKKNFEFKKVEPSWIHNKYEYNATPLTVVFKDLENLYNISVVVSLTNPSQEFSGKLISDDLDKALEIICKSMDINYKYDGKTFFIYN